VGAGRGGGYGRGAGHNPRRCSRGRNRSRRRRRCGPRRRRGRRPRRPGRRWGPVGPSGDHHANGCASPRPRPAPDQASKRLVGDCLRHRDGGDRDPEGEYRRDRDPLPADRLRLRLARAFLARAVLARGRLVATRRRSERRATLWADTSEWVYRASAGATSRLTSAAPMRGPFDPEEGRDHGPADRGQRSCQQLGNAELFHTTPGGSGWGRRRCRGAPRARPDAAPAAASSAPTLATQAGSRQAPPGQEGDRAAWSRCSPGERFRAALVQRAELEAAQGPGEAGSRTTPSTSSLPEFANPNGTALFLTVVPESCSPIRNPAAVSEPVAHAGGPGTTLTRPSPTLQRTLGRSNIRA
jgi:hypothetical protein